MKYNGIAIIQIKFLRKLFQKLELKSASTNMLSTIVNTQEIIPESTPNNRNINMYNKKKRI